MLKLNYNCMGNVASVLLAQNRIILYPEKVWIWLNLKSRSRTDCPIDSKCLTPKFVYKAGFQKDTNDDNKFYLAVSETHCEECFRN